MKPPELSEHYIKRKPSVIRSAQIECSKRVDIDSITVINLAIGNINLPMHPSMISRLKGLGKETFRDGVVKYTSSEGNQETKDAFLNILASDGVWEFLSSQQVCDCAYASMGSAVASSASLL